MSFKTYYIVDNQQMKNHWLLFNFFNSFYHQTSNLGLFKQTILNVLTKLIRNIVMTNKYVLEMSLPFSMMKSLVI